MLTGGDATQVIIPVLPLDGDGQHAVVLNIVDSLLMVDTNAMPSALVKSKLKSKNTVRNVSAAVKTSRVTLLSPCKTRSGGRPTYVLSPVKTSRSIIIKTGFRSSCKEKDRCISEVHNKAQMSSARPRGATMLNSQKPQSTDNSSPSTGIVNDKQKPMSSAKTFPSEARYVGVCDRSKQKPVSFVKSPPSATRGSRAKEAQLLGCEKNQPSCSKTLSPTNRGGLSPDNQKRTNKLRTDSHARPELDCKSKGVVTAYQKTDSHVPSSRKRRLDMTSASSCATKRSRNKYDISCVSKTKVNNRQQQYECKVVDSDFSTNNQRNKARYKGPPWKGTGKQGKGKNVLTTDEDNDSDSDSSYEPFKDVESSSNYSHESSECETVKKPSKSALLLKALIDKERDQETDVSDDNDDDDDDFIPNDESESGSSDYSESGDESNTSEMDWPSIENDNRLDNWHEFIGKQLTFEYSGPDDTSDTDLTSPLECFRLFFYDEVLDLMVAQTNLNAAQVIGLEGHSAESRLRHWKEVTRSDMEQFIGLLIWMGLVDMPTIECYWKTSILYRNSVAPLAMPRNRFQSILRMWHFADNATATAEDRLHKLKPLIDLLVAKFKDARTPGETLVVDESMVPFRGRLSFRQYIPGKSHKYGVKLFKLCDEKGYTYSISVYTGKGDGQPTNVVMNLVEPYLGCGRTVCTDNYYTSIPLAQSLLKNKTHLVGTLRSNRKGLPATVCDASLKKGEIVARENDVGMVVMKWKDKRDVLMLSTRHDDTMTSTGKKNRNGESVVKPDAVLFYNSTKQGIDLSDQLSSYHTSVRKSIRWYHKLAEELLLGTCIVNALIMHNQQLVMHGKRVMQITDFKERIALSLLHGKDRKGQVGDNAGHGHFLCETDEREKGKRPDRRTRRCCIGCYTSLAEAKGRAIAKKKAKKVVTQCSGCPGNPRFCFKCFARYHP